LIPQSVLHASGNLLRHSSVRIEQQNRKLMPTVPRRQVCRTAMLFHHLGQPLQ
jgi:hypothetical protein